MLFALSVARGRSILHLSGKIESAPYIFMTLDTLKKFGADIEFDFDKNIFYINGKDRLISPSTFEVLGDWSNAAFFLCAGAIGSHCVTLSNLDLDSRQGDRAIISILREMGAKIECDNDSSTVTVHPSKLGGIRIDASDIPDLVPILSVVASVAEGETVICNASRLRLKESDRIESVCTTLRSLGADISPLDDGIVIHGQDGLTGGCVDSFNDHRIAMSAAIASLVCNGEVKISNFEAINKSYPSFLDGWEIKD
jgi:3-phosphoshikimate 1-carboxyvinyltransferase